MLDWKSLLHSGVGKHIGCRLLACVKWWSVKECSMELNSTASFCTIPWLKLVVIRVIVEFIISNVELWIKSIYWPCSQCLLFIFLLMQTHAQICVWDFSRCLHIFEPRTNVKNPTFCHKRTVYAQISSLPTLLYFGIVYRLLWAATSSRLTWVVSAGRRGRRRRGTWLPARGA